ncbi:MAG: nuclear transport factor 2 family protein [Sphingobium sp.]|nr:nuclear transport factor 2 family protein [Sphingobium sp.]
MTASSYAEDRAAIEQLEAEYLFAMDWGDAEAYAALFAPDGVLEWARGRAVGPAEICEEAKRFKTFIKQIYPDDESGKPVALRHFITNPAIFIHGERAKARAYWFEFVNTAPGGMPVAGSYGHYEDEMRKVDGQWKFVYRRIFNEQIDDRRAGAENPVRSARVP